jgi:hypothetical protein
MATVTGYTAAKIDEELDNAVVSASYNSGTGELTLTQRGGGTVGPFDVKGDTGDPGAKGDPGDVTAGVGWVGDDTLKAALDLAKAHTDLAGKGLVAMVEYDATDSEFSGGADSFQTFGAGLTLSYAFEAGRSYSIEYGVHIEFGLGSNEDNVVSLDLMESGVMIRRATIPGDTQAHQAGVAGSHYIKSSAWTTTKTLGMRMQKRGAADITAKHTVVPGFIAITDLGGRFI